jgi:hypothetical protein
MTNNKWITKINYKDIIIIYTLWFSTIVFSQYFNFTSFMQISDLGGFFDILFFFAARLIFISLMFLYFVFLYDLSFDQLGVKFKPLVKSLFKLIIYIVIILLLVIFLINIPLNTTNITKTFNPLYEINSVQSFVHSILPLMLVFPLFYIIALSEQFMLNLFVYEVFKFKLPELLAKFLAALFFSFLIYQLNPGKILIYFFYAIISILIYEKSEKSILVPAFLGAAFYSIYTFYIYGWTFIY